jgi:hypothetical protein
MESPYRVRATTASPTIWTLISAEASLNTLARWTRGRHKVHQIPYEILPLMPDERQITRTIQVYFER